MNEMETMTELSLGATLAQAREQAGLRQDEIAKKLYLSVSYIAHLEQDEYDKLDQSPVFVRGYARSYARLVGLDEVKINQLLDRNGIIEKNEPTKFVLPTRRRQASSKDKKVRWITYFIIVLFVILVAVWWHSQVSHKPTSAVSTQSVPSVSNTSKVVVQAHNPVAQSVVTAKSAAKNTPATPVATTRKSTPGISHQLHMDMSNG